MNVRKTDEFIKDLEQKYEWYAINAGWEVADRYLNAVQATCDLLSRYSDLGPIGDFTHPKLRQ